MKNIYVAAILLLFITAACKKTKNKPVIQKPAITSFEVVATTYTSATFSFNVSNSNTLKLSIDGGNPYIDVSGGSYTVNGLTMGKTYNAILTASNQGGSVSSSKSFTTNKSTLAISEFKVKDITSKDATFTFSASSDVSIVSQTLINGTTGEEINVTGKNSHTVSNLTPSTSYNFTFKVKDNAGGEVSQQLQFQTLTKSSEWMSITDVSYGTQFAIIGNAVSNKLTIKINNAASSSKVLEHLVASFGQNGTAVKMLRYSLNGGSWVKLTATSGTVDFANVTLQSGANTFECYFALKPTVGVANGSALSFTFTSMSDSEGGKLPKSGSFPVAEAVGSVNANVQATVIASGLNGYMFAAGVVYSENVSGTSGIYQILSLKATGPSGARFVSIKFKNPYTSFPGMVFGHMDVWKYELEDGVHKIFNNFSWQNDFVTLSLPSEVIINTNGSTSNHYYLHSNFRNNGPGTFNSSNYTKARMGFVLTSKYDIVLHNSNGQVIDLSDVVVKHEDVELNN